MLRTVDLLTRTRQLCLMADSPAAAKERPVSNSLMTSRRFAPLFWCQFFSAFNDNFLKNALVFLILFKVGGLERRGAGDARRRGLHRARSSSSPASAASLPTATTRPSSRGG